MGENFAVESIFVVQKNKISVNNMFYGNRCLSSNLPCIRSFKRLLNKFRKLALFNPNCAYFTQTINRAFPTSTYTLSNPLPHLTITITITYSYNYNYRKRALKT